MSHEPTRLEMPVRSVTLTQDRGRVVHRASVEWTGEGSLLLVGLSPQLVDISLQVRCTPGRVGRVEVIRAHEVAEPVASPAAAREVLEDESRRLVRREERLGQDLERTRAGREVLMAHIAAAAVRGEGAREEWASGLGAFHERELSLAEGLAEVGAARAANREAMANLAVPSTPAEPEMVCRVAVGLSARAGRLDVEVSYITPSAVWRPTYLARLRSDGLAFTTAATVWQRTGVPWSDVDVTLSTAKPASGATLPSVHHDRLQLRDRTAEERATIHASFREQTVNRASLTDAPSALPEVDDGGDAQRLAACDRMTLPSDGRPRRVRIGEFEVAGQPRLVCFPELGEAVFPRLEIENRAGHPLLAGPVLLFGETGPIGTAEVGFVASGERFPLALGVEENIRVRYSRDAVTDSLMGMRSRRWLLQKVELWSDASETRTVEVLLRLPVSELEQVTVHVDSDKRSSPGYSGPDDQGHVRWRVSLEPGEHATRTLAFRLEAEGKVELTEPW